MRFTFPVLRHTLFATIAMTALSAQAALYPELPVGIKNGAGALIENTVYVGLGTAGNKFFSLNLTEENAKWQELPDFPGGERMQPVAAAVDGKLYVLGGTQKNEKGELRLVNDAYRYDPTNDTWVKLETRSPLGLSGAVAATHKNKIYLLGGMNSEIVNGYFQDFNTAGGDRLRQKAVMEPYFNQRPQDYFLNTEFFSYEPSSNKWYNEGNFPFAPRAGALMTIANDTVIVVNGEIKPGLRTASTEQGKFTSKGIEWRKLADLPAQKGKTQDGLAGAMGGYSNGHYLVTGGANFPGATQQFKEGRLFAHEGLSKVWHKEVYTLGGKGGWRIIGELPVGVGYGVSISYNNKVLLIGGETDGGKALTSVQTISYDGKTLTVE